MALFKNITTLQGITVPNAYAKIGSVTIINKNQLVFNLQYFVNNLKENPQFFEESFVCSYDINGANPLIQGYLYLKNLPDFVTSQNC